MKKYLLKTKLFAWAYRQGGIDSFALARKDILETMYDDVERRATELTNQKLVDMLSVVNENMIVSTDSITKAILIGGKRLDESQIANLKADAEFIINSDLWQLLHETPKALAEKAMFTDDGKLETQLLKGRVILFTLATQKKIVDIFLKLSTQRV